MAQIYFANLYSKNQARPSVTVRTRASCHFAPIVTKVRNEASDSIADVLVTFNWLIVTFSPITGGSGVK